MKEIIIEIDTQGNTVVTTKGYRGKSCKDATKQLEAALGEVTQDAVTADILLTETHEHNRAKH